MKQIFVLYQETTDERQPFFLCNETGDLFFIDGELSFVFDRCLEIDPNDPGIIIR